MINRRINPHGIDLYIDRFQTDLYNKLVAKWPVGVIHNSYARASRNLVNGKYRAEVYNPAGIEPMQKEFIFANADRSTVISIKNDTGLLATEELSNLLVPEEISNFSLINEIEKYSSPGEYNYVDALWDDRVDVVSFFGTDTTTKNMTQKRIGVHLVVFCNTKSVKGSTGERAEEDIKIDFMNTIGKALYGFHFISVETGIENVLKEYKGSAEMIKSLDFHPLHVFRINFLVSYNQNFTSSFKLN